MTELEEWVREDQAGERLDVILAALAAGNGASRSQAAKWIADGCVTVDGITVLKPGLRLKGGEQLLARIPPPREMSLEAEDIPIRILYEDASLAVIEKPAGMVVHPGAGNPDHTLVNSLLFHLDSLSGIGGQARPGIVHRLDKDTSGVMLVAKNDQAHHSLTEQLARRETEKHYRALVLGRMSTPEGEVDRPIARSRTERKKMCVDPAGRSAVTRWKVLEERGRSSFLDVRILTGRTHQIRVHMSYLGHPVLGDVIYGRQTLKMASRLMLHAFSITFSHPVTGERMTFTSPCPF